METEIYKNLSLENLPNEEWRVIEDYEGFMVSNLGRVKMLSRIVPANKSQRTIKEHILKQYETTKKYLNVHLWKDNKCRQVHVHKLVLSAFLGCKEENKECNHKNENRKDNRIDNLEWVSHKENINYGNRTRKHSAAMRNHPSLSKPVIQLDLNGNFVSEYPSLREAGRIIGRSFGMIKECCKGRVKSAYGFKWNYKQ